MKHYKHLLRLPNFMVWVVCLLLVPIVGKSQALKSIHGITLSAFYNSEFVVDGYVQVREWEMKGDKMQFEELGINHYPALQLQLEKQFRRKNSIALSYERYYLQGTSSFNRTIEYNGTVIEGASGIDVSPTRYFRLSATYRGNLYTVNDLLFQLIAGVVYDHATFYLDGKVAASSPRDEVYEQFGRQALPYPVLGLTTNYSFNKNNSLQLDMSGTYIPLFESFFVEGGEMNLRYSTFLTELKYVHRSGHFNFTIGSKYRNMHLFEESNEDTNELKMDVVAPYLGVGFVF